MLPLIGLRGSLGECVASGGGFCLLSELSVDAAEVVIGPRITGIERGAKLQRFLCRRIVSPFRQGCASHQVPTRMSRLPGEQTIGDGNRLRAVAADLCDVGSE